MIPGDSIRFAVEPRDLPVKKAARLLHLTELQFIERLGALYERGFPRPDPTTGMYDSKAIHQWMDERHQPRPPRADGRTWEQLTIRERVQEIGDSFQRPHTPKRPKT